MAEEKKDLVRCFSDGQKNRNKNLLLFDKTEPEWKSQLLSPQAVVGGIRSMVKPCLLYRAPSKRITKYGKDTYALEMTGVNHLGNYYLSKHLFNLSFLHDPFLRQERHRQVNRSSIEVAYQVGNYWNLERGVTQCGLFLRPITVMCDRGTLEQHGWYSLQTAIEPLVEDIDISLAAVDHEEAARGYFSELLPNWGRKKPSPDTTFVLSIYQQLEAASYLEKKRMTMEIFFIAYRKKNPIWIA